MARLAPRPGEKPERHCQRAGRSLVNWSVGFEAPAQAEIAEAFAWYEEKSYGLGGDYLRVIAAAAEQLARDSQATGNTAPSGATATQIGRAHV